MRAQLVVAVVVETFHGGLFDRAVHPFDLSVGPWVVGLCQAVFNTIGLADHVEAHRPGVDRVSVPRLLCELDSVVGENGVDLIGHGFEQVLKEFPGCLSVGFFDELGHSEFARSVDANEQI